MSSIKNLKSGSVPCKDSGNSVIPGVTLDWDKVRYPTKLKTDADYMQPGTWYSESKYK